MGVTPNYPKFGAEWGVVATKPKFFVHFFDLRENYARYQQNCTETLLEARYALSKSANITRIS